MHIHAAHEENIWSILRLFVLILPSHVATSPSFVPRVLYLYRGLCCLASYMQLTLGVCLEGLGISGKSLGIWTLAIFWRNLPVFLVTSLHTVVVPVMYATVPQNSLPKLQTFVILACTCAVRQNLLAARVFVQFRVNSRVICAGQIGTGSRFLIFLATNHLTLEPTR
jgi:hypothetical protein